MSESEMTIRSTAKIRDRGQLTIPAEVRRAAELDEGAVVEFEVVEEGVLLRPQIVLDEALDPGFIREIIETTTAGYEALRASEDDWASEQAERRVLEGSIGDGLEQ